MEEAIRQRAPAELVEPGVPGVSWAAVTAGAIASLALTLLLLSFGAGMGFAAVYALGEFRRLRHHIPDRHGPILRRDGDDFVGARRISSRDACAPKWIGVRSAEVLFRDSAHGFLAWALASVLGAVLLASPASSLIGAGVSVATQAAANSAQSSPMDHYVDVLLRPENPSSQAQQSSSDARAEMVRLFTASFKDANDLGAVDRTYVAKLVSARTGLNQQDAEKRVNDVTTQIKSDMDICGRPRCRSRSG